MAGGHPSTRTKSQVTDATLLKGTETSNAPMASILNKTETQPGGMGTPGREEDKLIEKPVTPISLSYAKKTML